MPEYNMALVPRDGVAFRDGRGWYTSAAARGYSLSWPYPSTLRGAMRTAWGFASYRQQHGDEGQPSKAFWLRDTAGVALRASMALRRPLQDSEWSSTHRMWPIPHDALFLRGKEQVIALQPQKSQVMSLGTDLSGYVPEQETADLEENALSALWHPYNPDPELSKPAKAPLWWTEAEFVDWLCGLPVTRQEPSEAATAPHKRFSLHLKIKPSTQTAEDAMLYAKEVLETTVGNVKQGIHQWAFGLKTAVPRAADAFPPAFVRLGGKQHIAFVEHEGLDDVFAPPKQLLKLFQEKNFQPKGIRLIAATPAHFASGWRPDFLSVEKEQFVGTLPLNGHNMELVLRAACVPRPHHVSGWDMAQGQPKPTRRLVAPGSVYFFQKRDGTHFTREEFETLWLHQLGKDNEDGFGTFVPGIWHTAS